ncbi:MAG: transcription factor S [Promethearchaeota archaeon]
MGNDDYDFCPKCEGMLFRKKQKDGTVLLRCRCGWSKVVSGDEILEPEVEDPRVQQKILKGKTILLEGDQVSQHPVTNKTCPKCQNGEAEFWQQQTRSADEPSTSFFRCTKCHHVWREY